MLRLKFTLELVSNMSGRSTDKTAVIYARFSCSKQREASIEDQLRECHAWCDREGYEVVAEYADRAISGRTDVRPEFQQMIANAGESEIVLVYMMDRFSRDAFDAPIYKRELLRKGVKLISALEAIPDSPEGIIYEKLLEGLAACESRKTAIRTLRGMEGNAMKAKTNGVHVFGYKRDAEDHFVIDEDEASIVREVFRRRIHGETCNSIARDLARRGIKTRTGRPCKYSMVYNMLHNEKYIGKYSWGEIDIPDGMPKIIDDDTFYRAQQMKGKRDFETEEWGNFALSGRVICSHCGRNMQGVSGHGKGGKKYEYYDCRKCDIKAVRRDWLESTIAHELRGILSDRDETLRIAKVVSERVYDPETEAQRKQANLSLVSAKNGLRNILDAIEQGVIAPGVKNRIAELEAQQSRAEHDLRTLKETEIDPDEFVEFLQMGVTLDDKALLDAFVYQVLVNDDDIIVTLNYDTEKREPARLTLSRVRLISDWCPQRDLNPCSRLERAMS